LAVCFSLPYEERTAAKRLSTDDYEWLMQMVKKKEVQNDTPLSGLDFVKKFSIYEPSRGAFWLSPS
jgi:hypothetical protein